MPVKLDFRLLSIVSISLGTVFAPMLAFMEPVTFLGLSNKFWSGFLGGAAIVGCVATICISESNRQRL